MSWHIEVCGTKEDVCAAIDEAVANPHGMPPVVGAYLKDAVAACADRPGHNVHVKSVGHRPLENSGSTEESTVRLLRSGTWAATQPKQT